MKAPDLAVAEVNGLLKGEPVFVVGSAVAATVHGLPDYGDVDVFTPSQPVLFTTVQRMLDSGATLDERYSRVWYRWLRFGLKGWHTNSIQLHTRSDTPVNVVLKLVDGHPTTSMAQVLESFDFGLLAVGHDLEEGRFRDLRTYLFPGYDIDGPLPLMPSKRSNWINGFISQYNGLREGLRYSKYHNYGYDLSLVKDDLVTGYRAAAKYHSNHFDADKQLLGEIYTTIADLIEDDDVKELTRSYEQMDFNDPLDRIMEALV